MRCRKKDDPSVVVSVMTYDDLRRYADAMATHEWFPFHGLRIDAHRVFMHNDPMFVLYRDGVEVGQIGAHDRLVIEDDSTARPVPREAFEAQYTDTMQ